MKIQTSFAVILCFTLCAVPMARATEEPSQERDYWDIMVELTETFESDSTAIVSVAEARIPNDLAQELDEDSDGGVDRREFWSYQEKYAQRPYSGPNDRSEMSVEREGGFPMNLDPEIVSATEAGLGDDDMVMGVVIAGEARAYPVNYMNGPLNEVVNDELGGAHIAPSW